MDGTSWLLTTYPSLPAVLRRRLGLEEGVGGAEQPTTVVDAPLLAASYLLALLPVPQACPQLPPPPPFLASTTAEDEEDEDDVLREALAVLAGHAAVDGNGGVGAGWGGIPVYFFEEQRQRLVLQPPTRPQQAEGEAAWAALVRDVLVSGQASGHDRITCLPRCWAHVEEGHAAAAAATEEQQQWAASPLLEAKAGVMAVQATRWGLLPEAERDAFQRDLLHLCSSRPALDPWYLGALLIVSLGRVEGVLNVLPGPEEEGKAMDIAGTTPAREGRHGDEGAAAAAHLADAVAEAFAAELPAAAGALERAGLAVRALVMSWVRHAFWGTLSGTELGVAAALTAVGGAGVGQGCVALALLRHLHMEGTLARLVVAAEGDPFLAHDALLRFGKGFEFSPEVAAWIEEVWRRRGPGLSGGASKAGRR